MDELTLCEHKLAKIYRKKFPFIQSYFVIQNSKLWIYKLDVGIYALK